MKDSIFLLVGNKLAVFVWSLGHFLSALAILLSVSVGNYVAWFNTLALVLSIIALVLASADLLCVLLCHIVSFVCKSIERETAPLIRNSRPSVQSGCLLLVKRYSGLFRLAIAEMLIFL